MVKKEAPFGLMIYHEQKKQGRTASPPGKEKDVKNTLKDLNNYLFEAIERINDDSLDDEALTREIRRGEAVTKIAGMLINSANVQLQAVKHMDEYGYKGERSMPALLSVGEGARKEGKADA